MPTDAAFNPNAESDPFTGFSYVDLDGGSGYVAWAEDGTDGSVLAAGVTPPISFTSAGIIACSGPTFNAFYDDGSGGSLFHPQAAEFYAISHGIGLVFPVGEAADTLLAAHPDIDYFTLEPSIQIDLHPYATGCPTGFTQDGPPPYPVNLPPAEVRADAAMGTDPAHQFVDSLETPYDLAVSFGGSWYVDDHWGGDVYGDYTDSYALYQALGFSSGIESYLLRPTSALTWDGQDSANTANRMFWARDDIPDSIWWSGQWSGGHPTVQAGIALRGWKLNVVATEGPVICFI